jgi:hypothetical protein
LTAGPWGTPAGAAMRSADLGLIDYNGHLQIHSSLLNVVLHDDPHIDR